MEAQKAAWVARLRHLAELLETGGSVPHEDLFEAMLGNLELAALARPATPSLEEVLSAAESRLGIPYARIIGRDRSQKTVMGRHLVIYLCRELTAASYPAIGWAVGRDHSTAIYAHQQIRDRIEREPAFGAMVAKLRREISELMTTAAVARLREAA